MKSIIQTDDKCFNCHQAFGSQTHHVFGGPNRKHSDDDGLTVRMCPDCHDDIHFSATKSKKMMDAMHKLGQQKWEAYYGPKLEQEGKDVRKTFMERYGKNYL